MRAIEPVEAGTLQVAGFQIGYEVFGDPNAPPLLLLPTWQIVHSRIWKMQVPFLARFCRVITFDSPGNGTAERTTDPRAFEYDRIVDQAIGLLDNLHVKQADVIGFSRGCAYGLWMAARYPERVSRLVLIGNIVTPDWMPSLGPGFWERRESYNGWEKRNAHYWREHYQDWLEFFFNQVFSEPHSTKPFDDCIAWGLETTPDILTRTVENPALLPSMPSGEAIARVQCPVLIVHGDDDRIVPITYSQLLAAARPDWDFVTLEGSGHAPHVRDPVQVNLMIRKFLRCDHP